MPTTKLLLGTIDANGQVTPRPIIVTLGADNRIVSWSDLDGREPHSTTAERALLQLPSLTLKRLD